MLSAGLWVWWKRNAGAEDKQHAAVSAEPPLANSAVIPVYAPACTPVHTHSDCAITHSAPSEHWFCHASSLAAFETLPESTVHLSCAWIACSHISFGKTRSFSRFLFDFFFGWNAHSFKIKVILMFRDVKSKCNSSKPCFIFLPLAALHFWPALKWMEFLDQRLSASSPALTDPTHIHPSWDTHSARPHNHIRILLQKCISTTTD